MLGLALGAAFLTGFGLGAAAVIVWLGIGLVAAVRHSLPLAPFAMVLALASLGAVHAERHEARSASAVLAGPFEGRMRVSDGPYLTSLGQRFVGRPESFDGLHVCAYADAAPRALAGDVLFVKGRVVELKDLSEVGRAAIRARGCAAQLRIESMSIVESGGGFRTEIARIRVDLTEFLMRSAPGDTGALLSGLVTGDDGGLSGEASGAFLASGTTHITAISGANFAMLTLLLGVLATGAMRRHIAFVLGASIVIWLYAVMVGLQPSALRAALLATAVLVGRYLGRRPDLLTLTVLLAALQIAIRPDDFHTLAFQLSVAATVALIIVFDGSERGTDRWWGTTLGLSVVAAQLATIPILAWHIGTLSITGLLANLVVGPAAGVAFPIALAGALAGQTNAMLGELILLPAEWICRGIIIFVEWIDRYAPGSVQLGQPTPAAIGIVLIACWIGIFALSGDIRRTARHGFGIVKSW
jgi:ComEC/Rec2-related protein